MRSSLGLALAASAIIALPAMAADPAPAPASSQTGASAPVHQMKAGEWRASKLNGLAVYNANNDKIGDINELIIDRDGRVAAVVVGAGGFLGMGEHDVAVPFKDMRWSDVPRDHTAANVPANPPANTPANAARRNTESGSSNPPAADRAAYRGYPDHAVLNMTKEQLKALPEVQYAR